MELQLAEWHDFYLALATAATTFTGLLFVAVSINLEHLRSETGARALRVAGRVFSALVLLVFVALVALIPGVDSVAFAVTLALGGAQGVVRLGTSVPLLHRERRLRTAVLPGVGYLGLCGVALLLALGRPQALSILVAPITFLLASASTQAWRLLLLLRAPVPAPA